MLLGKLVGENHVIIMESMVVRLGLDTHLVFIEQGLIHDSLSHTQP